MFCQLSSDYQNYIVCNGEYFDPLTSQIDLAPNFSFTGVTDLKNGSFCSMSVENNSAVFDGPGNKSNKSDMSRMSSVSNLYSIINLMQIS